MNANLLSPIGHTPVRNPPLAILLLLVLPVLGCQTDNPDNRQSAQSWVPNWDIRKAVGWHHEKHDAPSVPTRIVSTWTDTVLHRSGQKPMRGFGGRLVFFDQDEDEPIPVRGQLVVYAFDETERDGHDTAPTRKYVFPTEQFARLEGPSKLGTSYSVWLPWDKVGGAQKNVSLIVRFQPTEGSMILGEQTRHLLPGLALADHAPDNRQPADYLKAARQLQQPWQSTPASGQVQLASADLSAADTRPPAHGQEDRTGKKNMSTTTIRLPSNRAVGERSGAGG